MEVFSVCVRMIVVTVNYCIFDMLFTNYLYVRRRSRILRYIVIAIGLMIKNFVIQYLLLHSQTEELMIIQIQFIYSILLALITYALLCYTFQGSVLKLGLFQIALETNFIFLTGTILPIINWVEKRSYLGSVQAPFQMPDLLLIPIVYVLLRFELYLLKPWLLQIRNYKPRHKKILWIIVVVYVIGGIGTMFINYTENGLFCLLVRMPAILVFIPGCMVCTYLFFRYRGMTERTNAFVREQKKLTELHYTFVRRQIRSMEQEQEKIDAQMQKITAMTAIRKKEKGSTEDYEERIRNYLDTLRDKFDKIQAGIYCQDYLLDSVLCHMAQQCRKKGIKESFSFQKYDRGVIQENDLAEILFQILDYCVRECIAYLEKNENQSPFVFLCAAAVKNQLLMEFSCCSVKSEQRIKRELKRTIMPLLLPYHGELEKEEGNEKRFCVRMQRG